MLEYQSEQLVRRPVSIQYWPCGSMKSRWLLRKAGPCAATGESRMPMPGIRLRTVIHLSLGKAPRKSLGSVTRTNCDGESNGTLTSRFGVFSFSLSRLAGLERKVA